MIDYWNLIKPKYFHVLSTSTFLMCKLKFAGKQVVEKLILSSKPHWSNPYYKQLKPISTKQ